MSENKTGKYFKYAIGEIILVVIGILIALSINNWNENKKESRKEIELLSELKENLTQDIIVSKELIKTQNKHIIDIEKLITHLENGRPYNDTLPKYFFRSRIFEQFQINSSAYETLKSIGLEKLSSKLLKKEVTQYYDLNVRARSQIAERVTIEQRIPLQEVLWEHRKTYSGPQEKFYFHVATQGRFFINYLHARKSWKGNFIRDVCEANLKEAEYLVSLIDKVLIELKI